MEELHLMPPVPLGGENRQANAEAPQLKATKGDVDSTLQGQYLGQRKVSDC